MHRQKAVLAVNLDSKAPDEVLKTLAGLDFMDAIYSMVLPELVED